MERTLFEKLNLQMHPMVIAFFLVGFSECGGSGTTPCPDTDCADYTTQQQAQEAFDADPGCRGDLDADNDGIACEQLPTGSRKDGCSTTSNCGCSGKNKSECGGPCCKWVVGTGCRCS